MIRVDNLHYSYPDGQKALRGVSFHIKSGETVGLIGPNGAGKSTLLLHLNGLIGVPQQQGQVLINQLKVEEPHLPEIRRRVGLLFQNPDDQIFSATVWEDVAFGPRQLGLEGSTLNQRVAQSLEAVKMVGFDNRTPYHLSLGEKRRVCLAGVWACQPEVLIFDEPTANFDPRGRKEFIELCRSLPSTKLIASHDLEMILCLCSTVLLLDHGVIAASGPTREILNNETLMLEHGLERPHSLLHHPQNPGTPRLHIH